MVIEGKSLVTLRLCSSGFHPEDGGGSFLQRPGNHLQNCTKSIMLILLVVKIWNLVILSTCFVFRLVFLSKIFIHSVL